MIIVSRNANEIALVDDVTKMRLILDFDVISLSSNENYVAVTLETPARSRLSNLYLLDKNFNIINTLKAPDNISESNIFTDVNFLDNFTDLIHLRDWDGHQYSIQGKTGVILKKEFTK